MAPVRLNGLATKFPTRGLALDLLPSGGSVEGCPHCVFAVYTSRSPLCSAGKGADRMKSSRADRENNA